MAFLVLPGMFVLTTRFDETVERPPVFKPQYVLAPLTISRTM